MDTELVARWTDPARSLLPLAPLTGPFARHRFLEAWAEHCIPAGSETLIAQSNGGALPIWIDGDVVRFQGDADLTDYHTPLGSSTDSVIAAIASTYAGRRFSFDSLPTEATDALERALDHAGAALTTSVHTTALIVDLPREPGAWLASLTKKHRHEVRRKQRRFADTVGTPHHDRLADAGALDAFISLHRMADGRKGTFMTDARAAFFASLLSDAGATIDLLSVDDQPVAAAFGFAEPGAYYLYNSAYDPELANAAPGIVLLAMMLDRSVEDAVVRFDFLKGDERYKYHLGARERELSLIEGVFA